jgi:hypothetical protein
MSLEIHENAISEFVKRLPDLSLYPPTAHLVMLASRSKKIKELVAGVKIQDVVVERSIMREQYEWRDKYFNKVYNYSVLQAHGVYGVKTELRDIPRLPPEVMGIFGTIQPRAVIPAVVEMMGDNLKAFTETNEHGGETLARTATRMFGYLHKSKMKGLNFVTVDVDTRDRTVYDYVYDMLSPFKKFMTTETSGGYHFVLNVTESGQAEEFYRVASPKQPKEGVWEKICQYAKRENVQIELQRDAQEPIPGTLYCRKGGEHFIVRFFE